MCLKVSHLLNIKTHSLPECKSCRETPCPSHPIHPSSGGHLFSPKFICEQQTNKHQRVALITLSHCPEVPSCRSEGTACPWSFQMLHEEVAELGRLWPGSSMEL